MSGILNIAPNPPHNDVDFVISDSLRRSQEIPNNLLKSKLQTWNDMSALIKDYFHEQQQWEPKGHQYYADILVCFDKLRKVDEIKRSIKSFITKMKTYLEQKASYEKFLEIYKDEERKARITKSKEVVTDEVVIASNSLAAEQAKNIINLSPPRSYRKRQRVIVNH